MKRSGPVVRLISVGALCMAATFGVSACGVGGPAASKSDVVAKLKTESEFKSLNDKQIGCFADVLIKHGNKGDVKKYVDGKKKLDSIRQTSGTDKSLTKEAEACVTA